MSQEGARALFERIGSDEEFRAKVDGASTPGASAASAAVV